MRIKTLNALDNVVIRSKYILLNDFYIRLHSKFEYVAYQF